MSETRLSDLRKAAHAGYMAACREVLALVEETRKSSNITNDFTRGRCFEAKGIARTLGAIGPANSDDLRAALGEVMRESVKAGSDAGIIFAEAADIAALRRDAERYRKLRVMHWNESPLCVVADPKRAVRLGYDCPSGERLDAMLDAAK